MGRERERERERRKRKKGGGGWVGGRKQNEDRIQYSFTGRKKRLRT